MSRFVIFRLKKFIFEIIMVSALAFDFNKLNRCTVKSQCYSVIRPCPFFYIFRRCEIQFNFSVYEPRIDGINWNIFNIYSPLSPSTVTTNQTYQKYLYPFNGSHIFLNAPQCFDIGHSMASTSSLSNCKITVSTRSSNAITRTISRQLFIFPP